MVQEQTFSISTTIGGNSYQFTISPEWDGNKQEQYYVAVFENNNVGKLRKTEFDYWYWELGTTKFNASVAHFIGEQIDLLTRRF